MLTNYDLPNGIVDVQLPNGGRGQYRIIEQLAHNTKPYYDIIYMDDHYWDGIAGPYMTFEEAQADLTCAIERHVGRSN